MSQNFIFEKLQHSDVGIVHYPSFGDNLRGADKIYEDKIDDVFNKLDFQVNESMIFRSGKGVLRGMHYQSANYKRQDRVLYVLSGKLFIAVVNLREWEVNYGKSMGFTISESDRTGLYVPGDYAIGTLAEKDSTFLMFYNGVYEEGSDFGFLYDDAEIQIDWPMEKEKICIADKDLQLPVFRMREK